MKPIASSFSYGIVLCHLLLSGCTGVPSRDGSTAPDNTWRFDAYRITEGRGQLFADANNSYAILPKGAKAVRVQAPGGIEHPKWSQQGAVIRIDGCQSKLLIVPESGERLVAESTCPAPQGREPESKHNLTTRLTTSSTRSSTHETGSHGVRTKPLKQAGKAP